MIIRERNWSKNKLFQKGTREYKRDPVRNEQLSSWKKKKTLEGMNSKLSDTEKKKCIGDLEDRTKEIIWLEQAERKKLQESNLIYLYDYIKHYNIGVIGDSEREERERAKQIKNICEDIMAKKFTNLKKETHIQLQEA